MACLPALQCVVGSAPECPAPSIVPPDQGPWHFATCHQHWHLQGYADYYLTRPVNRQCSTLPACPKNNSTG